MFNLFELKYSIQKELFFSGKISSEAYNIYYSNNMADQHCNFAVFSDVVPIDSVYSEVAQHFEKLKRPVSVYVDSVMGADMQSLLDKKFKVSYCGEWLRYDSVTKIEPSAEEVNVKTVSSEKDLSDFLEVFEECYSKKGNHYGQCDVNSLIDAIKKNYANPKYHHFVSYDGRTPVCIASVGAEQGFCIMFNQGGKEEYLNSPCSHAIYDECMKLYRAYGNKSMNTRIISNPMLERWYAKGGFKKNKVVYRLTLDK